ncbi:hypothetical protein HispidOSU_003097, partial [Sigmodon hispidus]
MGSQHKGHAEDCQVAEPFVKSAWVKILSIHLIYSTAECSRAQGKVNQCAPSVGE